MSCKTGVETVDHSLLSFATPFAHQWITESDRRHFEDEGYLLVRNVIPAMIIQAAVREIAEFVGADPNDSATWYSGAAELDGIVPMHHAQSLWDIRQSENLYEVFAQFIHHRKLMVDMNRCIFRPPVHQGWPSLSRGSIHWDCDPRLPGPGSLQGVVMLTDVSHDGGGFQCIPEIYQHLDAWLERNARRDDFDFFKPGLDGLEATQIEAYAGDVILWSTKLPHGTATNLSNIPRIAAFVSMGPATQDSRVNESMKEWWLTKRAPDYWRGMPGQLDPEPGLPACLSELGLKLIGALPW